MLAYGSLFSKRFIVNHLDKVETFFAEIWSLIRNGFATVKAA